jgi:hypothetical protein
MSRYIGVGTYDTDVMKTGKLVQMNFNAIHAWKSVVVGESFYAEISDYRKLIIGHVNFHKHKNHGIEFRIFDYFDEKHLKKF